MFIQSSSVASLVSEASLQAFCAAMNAPVVNIEELDVNPARAAIALCAGEYGDSWLVVAVRSLASGEGVIFKYQGDPAEFGSDAAALEAGLSFAEGMGFIFDTDLMAGSGTAGRRRAWKIWRSLVAPAGSPNASGDSSDSLDVGSTRVEKPGGYELAELEEGETLHFAGGIPGVESPGDEGGEEELGTKSSQPPAQVLTKFRGRAVGAIGATPDPASAPAHGDGGRRNTVSSAGPGRSASDSQSAQIGVLAIETSSLGMEIDDGWEFLTRLVSSF